MIRQSLRRHLSPKAKCTLNLVLACASLSAASAPDHRIPLVSSSRGGTSVLCRHGWEEAVVEDAHPSDVFLPLRQIANGVADTLRLLVRALMLFMAWSPVAASAYILDYCEGCGVLPDETSTKLREAWWKTLLHLIEFSGPTFIKAAQWASTRRDIFPAEVCDRWVCTADELISPRHDLTLAIPSHALMRWRRTYRIVEVILGYALLSQDMIKRWKRRSRVRLEHAVNLVGLTFICTLSPGRLRNTLNQPIELNAVHEFSASAKAWTQEIQAGIRAILSAS